MKKIIILLTIFSLAISPTLAFGRIEGVPPSVKLPKKFTQEYIDYITEEYKIVTNNQLIMVALDMLKGTDGDFSRKAILGYNLTGYPIKIEFKNLATVNKSYENFDAIGWKKRKKFTKQINYDILYSGYFRITTIFFKIY